MKYLIINADDFGLTRGVNAAVVRAHKCGTLTSATLMAGGLAWQEAVDLALATPSLGVGVHLTLSALKPVLPPEQVSSLVNDRGYFRRQFWRAPLWNKEQVAREWRAQIQRLLDAGLRPTHLDSHHHTHLWPGLTQTVGDLAREFGIPAVRFISPRSFKIMGIGGWQRHLAAISWRRAKKYPLVKPATVSGIEAFPLTKVGVAQYLASLNSGVHELYCHPGSSEDGELAAVSSLRERRVQETQLLCSTWLRELLAEENIPLINYRDLGEESF